MALCTSIFFPAVRKLKYDLYFSEYAIVRRRRWAIGVRGRSPLSCDRLQLLDTVRSVGRRLSRVQLPTRACSRWHHRAAHHRSRSTRTTAQDVVPARSAANATRAFSHARQH